MPAAGTGLFSFVRWIVTCKRLGPIVPVAVLAAVAVIVACRAGDSGVPVLADGAGTTETPTPVRMWFPILSTSATTTYTVPAVGATWFWQLTEIPSLDYAVDVYDLDMEYLEDEPQVMQALKGRDVYVICYISAGAWEEYRKDAADFPEELKTKYLEEWDEWYLDISQLDDFGADGSKRGMRTLLTARLDRAAAIGCDGVEPDVLDTFEADVPRLSGGVVTWQDEYNLFTMLVQEAHARGMSIGLKNLVTTIPAAENGIQDLSALFDWTIQESAYRYETVELVETNLDMFTALGNAVFVAEYEGTEVQFRDVICPSANTHNYHALKFRRELDGPALLDCRNLTP